MDPLGRVRDILPPEVERVPTDADFERVGHGMDAMMDKMVNMIWADAATRAYQTVRDGADAVKDKWDWGVPVEIRETRSEKFPRFVIYHSDKSMRTITDFRPFLFVIEKGGKVMTTSEEVVRDHLKMFSDSSIPGSAYPVYAYPLDSAEERLWVLNMYTHFLVRIQFQTLMESRMGRCFTNLITAAATGTKP